MNWSHKSKSYRPSSIRVVLLDNEMTFALSYLHGFLFSRLPWENKEVHNSLAEQDYAFVYKLSDTAKLELITETMFYIYIGACLMSLAEASHWELLAHRNPFEKRDTWKRKHDIVFMSELNYRTNYLSFRRKLISFLMWRPMTPLPTWLLRWPTWRCLWATKKNLLINSILPSHQILRVIKGG